MAKQQTKQHGPVCPCVAPRGTTWPAEPRVVKRGLRGPAWRYVALAKHGNARKAIKPHRATQGHTKPHRAT
eukprot:10517581-Lingulodinium_polyedra.AAC.1